MIFMVNFAVKNPPRLANTIRRETRRPLTRRNRRQNDRGVHRRAKTRATAKMRNRAGNANRKWKAIKVSAS